MNPYYAGPPPPPQPPQGVSLDDLFGGPSTPAPSANVSGPSAHAPGAAPPPPPSYDALGGSGYGAAGAAPYPGSAASAHPQAYAPPPPPSPASAAYYGAAPPPPPPQGHYGGGGVVAWPPAPSAGVAPVPAPGVAHSGPGSPHAAPAATPAGEEDEREQLERIIRLRRELEQEQEREQRKKDELQTWGCTVCTFRNKLSEVKCEMCGSTRPGYTAPSPASAPAAPAPASPAAAPATRAGVTAWQCGLCLAPNDASAERCKVCYAYRSSGTPVPATGGGGGGGTGVVSATPFTTRWKCSVCGEVNPPSKAHCAVCHGFQRNGTAVADERGAGGGSPAVGAGGGAGAAPSGDPPLPTTWACSVCTYENPTSAAVCTACESGQRPRHLAPKKDKDRAKPHSHRGADAEAKKGGAAEAAKQWPCPTCTFLNVMGRKKCDMCGARRPEKYAAAADTTEARAEARREAQEDAEEVEWQDDDSVTECNNCHTNFTFLNRRHHCRLCGYVFCAYCSNYMLSLTEGSLPQRVCVNCYKARKEEEKKVVKGRKWLSQ